MPTNYQYCNWLCCIFSPVKKKQMKSKERKVRILFTMFLGVWIQTRLSMTLQMGHFTLTLKNSCQVCKYMSQCSSNIWLCCKVTKLSNFPWNFTIQCGMGYFILFSIFIFIAAFQYSSCYSWTISYVVFLFPVGIINDHCTKCS